MFKVLIADDEPAHRLGLIKHVRWNELGYDLPLQAEDAEEALYVTRDKQIDVVIADVCMPGMDGIEMVRQLKRRYSKIHVLIISGYEEFEFARAAVEAGAEAYLLKPLVIENVEHWLKKFKIDISKEIKNTEAELYMKKKLNFSLKITLERFLTELMEEDNLDQETIGERLELLDLPVNGIKYRIALFAIDEYNILLENSSKEGQSLVKSMMDIIKDQFDDYCYLIMVKLGPNRVAAFLLEKSSAKSMLKEEVGVKISRIQGEFYETNNSSITVYISREGYQWGKVNELYKEILNLLGRGLSQGKGQLFWTENSELYDFMNEFNVSSLYSEIIESINKNDAYHVSELIEAFFNLFIEKDFNFSYMQSISVGIIRELLRFSELIGVQLEKPYTEMFQQLLLCVTTSELGKTTIEIVTNYMKFIEDYKNKKISRTVELAMQYLREHLEDDTTVKELAEVVHMNSSYLSVLFKKETGQTISDFVSNIRIEKAKELLLQGDKICDIAKKVGYKNPSYFASQFKKALGYNPIEYRKNAY